MLKCCPPTPEKRPPPRTLQKPYAQGPMVVLGGLSFLMSEVPLYAEVLSPDHREEI